MYGCVRSVHFVALGGLAAGALVVGSATLWAGPLDPPPGAIAPTHKTLTEIEPRIAINASNTPGDAESDFVITQPGSYYLTGNLTGTASRCGIKIAASDVTVDLCGFTLTGVGDSKQGVLVSGTGLRNIAISNGAASGWGLSAIDTFGATHCVIDSIRASGNGGAGVRAGADSLVRSCTVFQNAAAGIATDSGCVIESCASSGNLSRGIFTQSGCVVSNCEVQANLGAGIDVFTGSTVVACSAAGNQSGIQSSGDCTVRNCTARSNTGVGIFTGIGCTVSECTAGSNAGDGIRVSTGCHVFGNNCRSNGLATGDGAGIHATGNDNRIEANNCTGADRGIDVDGAGNIIARNTCSGNTSNNWDVVAGNAILVVNATAAAAVTGNSGGVAPGSTDPNANFTY